MDYLLLELGFIKELKTNQLNFLHSPFFFFLAAAVLSSSTWDHPSSLQHVGSSSLTSVEPGPPALGAQSLSHWTTGEVPFTALFVFWCIFYFFDVVVSLY